MTEVVTVAKPPFDLSFDGGFIGDACSPDNPCGDAFECLTRFDGSSGAFPSGYCSAPCPKHTCFDHPDYPWSRCVTFTGLDTAACMIECRSNSDCRDGYQCAALPKSNRNGERYVCVPGEAASAAALRQLADRSPSDSEALVGSDVPSAGRNETPSIADELIRFNGDVETSAISEEQVPQPNSVPSVSMLVPTAVFLAVLTGFVFALIWRRRRAAHSASVEPSSERDSRGDRTPTTAHNPKANKARAKRASRPLVGPSSTHQGGSHEAPDLRVGDVSSRLKQAQTPRNPTEEPRDDESKSSGTLSSGELRNADTEQANDSSKPQSSGRDQTPGRQRTQHLVPSLRGVVGAEATSQASHHELRDDSTGRAAWKPKRISNPTSPGFAPTGFSARDTITSAAALAPPVSFEVCLHVVDRLLQDANSFRVQRGYKDILFIDANPTGIAVQLVDDHQVRIGVSERSMVKPTLATDRIRNHGFARGTTPIDAHVLSIVKLAASLLGIDADPANFQSVPLLATYAESSNNDIERFIQIASESGPESILETAEPRVDCDEGLIEIYRTTRQGAQILRRSIERLRSARIEGDEFDRLICPSCDTDVSEGSLSCRACGVPLHPNPFFCPECGRRNLLIADGRQQRCSGDMCNAELTRYVPDGEQERRRMSIVFSILSKFEDFQRLPPIALEDRFSVISGGQTVHIVQARDTTSTIILESERALSRTPPTVGLPSRTVDDGGMRFMVYERLLEAPLPIRSFGAFQLAENLFTLAAELSAPGLSLTRVVPEDLAVTPEGQCTIRYGHRLPSLGNEVAHSLQTPFSAPETRMGAVTSPQSNLYNVAAIWYSTVRGVEYSGERLADEIPDDLLIEPHVWRVLRGCLDSDPASRPESATKVLSILRNEKTLSDLI